MLRFYKAGCSAKVRKKVMADDIFLTIIQMDASGVNDFQHLIRF